MDKDKIKSSVLVVMALLVGTVAGGTALSRATVNAQSNTTPTTTQSAVAAPATNQTAPSVTSDGKFHSNEDPAHEKMESPEREAQENAGQMPTVK